MKPSKIRRPKLDLDGCKRRHPGIPFSPDCYTCGEIIHYVRQHPEILKEKSTKAQPKRRSA